ncbi:MAG TPA: response regulator transcription factor [Ktedonobacterales bacterium]
MSATTRRIRVLLVDDHIVTRAGARRILEDASDIEVVGEASDGQEALSQAEALRPDLVALDIDMPGMDGMKACQELLNRSDPPRVLALTGHDKDAYVREMARLGVHGYLLKSAGPEELIQAVRDIYQGGRAFSTEVSEKLRRVEREPGLQITAREQAVLLAVARGLKNQEIAGELSVSLNTVEFHMRNLLVKLGASSRTDALMRAQRLGWVAPPESIE